MRNVKLLIMLVAVLAVAGCATQRSIKPLIKTAPRVGLHLKTPVLMSVYDGRTNPLNPGAAATLKAQLQKIYGSNLRWVPYFQKTPSGRVSVRLRIIKLGAKFGSRIISSVAYTNALQSAQVSATGPWGPVVGSVSGTSSVLSGSFSGEGWWNGAAWLDVQIQDNRTSRTYHVTIPLAAEDHKSNILGYASANKAVRAAWNDVATQLTRVMDGILRTLRDAES